MATGYNDKRNVIEVYAEGNTVRYTDSAARARAEAALPRRRPAASARARANRERSLQMNVGYVAFLTAAAVITVMICVNYLRLQASYTTVQKENTALETSLGQLKIDNDEEYNRILSGVNLEHVKTVAMEKLGMVYAREDQIVTYDVQSKDYVRQYQDIPGNR